MKHFHVVMGHEGIILYNWKFDDPEPASRMFVALSEEMIEHDFPAEYFTRHETLICDESYHAPDIGYGIGNEHLKFLYVSCREECLAFWLN